MPKEDGEAGKLVFDPIEYGILILVESAHFPFDCTGWKGEIEKKYRDQEARLYPFVDLLE